MPSLLTAVKTKMSIYSHQRSRGLLEGQYASVFKGRSIDFDDLRQYVAGDDVKDIDWKATARSGQTLIKRYVAIRKHNIMLVVDTGRNMAARSASGEIKRDVSVTAAGVLGYIAQKHDDLVSMVAGDSNGSQYIPLKNSNTHLERILRYIDSHATESAAPSQLNRQLEYIANNIRRRMILIILADDLSLTEDDERLIRRLVTQHEILWLTIGDADPTAAVYNNDVLYDIANDDIMPFFIRSHKLIRSQFAASTEDRRKQTASLLQRLSITNERVNGQADVIDGIFRLLEKQRRVRR